MNDDINWEDAKRFLESIGWEWESTEFEACQVAAAAQKRIDALSTEVARMRSFIYGSQCISTENGVLLFEIGPCHPDSLAANTWREVNDGPAPDMDACFPL